MHEWDEAKPQDEFRDATRRFQIAAMEVMAFAGAALTTLAGIERFATHNTEGGMMLGTITLGLLGLGAYAEERRTNG